MNVLTLPYIERGDTSRPSIVLLHGVGMGYRMWLPQVERLSEHYHVIAPDMPGMASAGSDGPFTMRGATEEVARLIRERCAGRAHICGLSLGAMVAMQLVLSMPELVASLTLSAGQVQPNPAIMALERLILMVVPERSLLRDTYEQFARLDSSLADAAREDVRQTGKAGLIAAIREAGAVRFRRRLMEIHAPALVLCGAKDRANVGAARELARRLPHAELRIVPGVGHVWNLEKPQEFTQTLIGFVERVERASQDTTSLSS